LNKSQKFYELILVDSNSVSLTHTMDKYNPQQILYLKCIIRDVITAQEWKNPFEERKFSITFTRKRITTMTIKMRGIAPFLCNQIFTNSSLISMNNV